MDCKALYIKVDLCVANFLKCFLPTPHLFNITFDSNLKERKEVWCAGVEPGLTWSSYCCRQTTLIDKELRVCVCVCVWGGGGSRDLSRT